LISPTITLRKYSPEHGISLCLITKNESERLETFLSYFQSFVDEICIVDTGSADHTLEIAGLFTDKVEHFDMPGLELAQARNRSLALAEQPWILSLDPDEEIAFWDFPKLQRMTDDLETHAYTFEVINYQKEGAPIITNNIRLFRNDRRIYYTHPVHETVERSLQHFSEAVIKPADLPLHHFGYLKEDRQIQQKLEAYLVRNKAYREANPHDPLPWFNEALHYLNEGNYQEAIFFLNKSLELDPDFTAPYGQLAYINQEHAICLWDNLLQRMPPDHPGRPQAQQTLDNLQNLTPPRRLVGEARARNQDRGVADVFPK
jgi:glycosyltransferase involved in cell wall biosynthesis